MFVFRLASQSFVIYMSTFARQPASSNGKTKQREVTRTSFFGMSLSCQHLTPAAVTLVSCSELYYDKC